MKGVCVCVFVFLLVFVSGNHERGEPWVVKINQGLVRGYKEPENNFFTFYGIPYATAPVGSHKFKAPLPAPTWVDTLDATNRYIACPQGKTFMDDFKKTLIITENCLYINIYVPDTEETNLPVVVYVHGGAFQIGMGEMLAHTPLVKTGKVIAVNFNYRLGAHGFLCLGTEDVPGNAGMKDQVAALRWVRDNIAQFRGDPNEVTIAGYSAGSSSVDLLMLSKSASGLFNKVIPESGPAFGVWSVQSDPLQLAKQFALSHNFTNVDDIEALERYYKTTSLDVLLENTFLENKDATFNFVPCVETPTSEEIFLEDTPLNILKKGDFNKVKAVLVGFTKHEGMFRLSVFDAWKNDMNANFADFLPANLVFKSNEERNKVAKKIKQFYFGDKGINEETISGYVDYYTDIFFAYPALKTVRLYLEAGGDSLYLYEYSYFDDTMPAIHNYRGADHCTQSVTIVEASFLPSPLDLDNEGYKSLKKTMVDVWTSFITTGKPVIEKSSTFPSGWPATSLEKMAYMELNVVPELRYELLKERMEFWDGIYDKYYRQPIPAVTVQKPAKTEL